MITVIGLLGILATYTTFKNFKDDFDFIPSGIRQEANTGTEDKINYDPASAPEFEGNIELQDTPKEAPEENPEKSQARNKLEELLSNNTSTICDINQNENGQVVSGKLYIKHKNIKAEFTLKKDNNSYDSNLLKLDKTVYIWSKTNNMGYEFAVENDEEVFSLKDLELLTSDSGYNCVASEIGDSTFSKPNGVTFQSFTENLDQLIRNSESLCAICNNAPTDDARQTCREQLECN